MTDDAAMPGRRGSWLLRREAPIIGAVGLAGATAVVYANDPAAPGSRFPGCTVRAITGMWCPGCGLTRGVHALLHGDLAAALGFNLFTPVAVVGIVAAWWAWWCASRAIPFPARRLTVGSSKVRRWSDRALWGLFGTLIAYGLLRNIPAAPFTALAP